MKKLRMKMLAVAFASSVIVFLTMAMGLYFTLVSYNAHHADSMTKLISLSDGNLSSSIVIAGDEGDKALSQYGISLNDDSLFRLRYFTVYLDKDNRVTATMTDHIASVDEDMAANLSSAVLFMGKKVGYYMEYRYRLVEKEDPREKYIVFLDCHDTLYTQRDLLFRILFVTIFFAFAVMLVFAIFARKILEPFERNQRMQKQFITDASHELKTPLAVIDANAEVLKYKSGDNEWVDNITAQTKKMARLINQLLVLARMEEVGENFEKENLDLSQLLTGVVSRFEEVFVQKGVAFDIKITPEIMINANRNQMENLCEILVENASKYVTEGGSAGVSLKLQGGKKPVMTVSNSCEDAEHMDCEKIFERFYRTDESRTSSTGGHGIGLSIARRIVEQHRGTIYASAKEGVITFTVRF